MRLVSTCVLATALACGVAGLPAADFSSGPAVGAGVGAFDVEKCSGAEDGVKVGQKLCYVWKLGGRPVVLVFSRKTDDSLASLVKELDKLVTDKKDQKAFGVVNFLGADAEALKKSAEEFGTKNELKNTAVVVPVDNKTGPKGLKISDDAEVTVIFYNAKKVTATHAVKAGGLDKATVEKIIADGKEALDKAPPK